MPTFTRNRTRLDDSVVFERARSGDDEAFAELLSRFRADVYGYCLSRTRSTELAADLTQEVFARVLEAPADRVSTPRRWLFGVARNVCLDTHRAHGRSVAMGSDEALDARLERVVGADQHFLDHLELQNALLALSMLKPRYRDALIQRGILRWSSRAMAAAAGSTAGATDTLVSRARDALLRTYRELDDMPGECRDVTLALHRHESQHGALQELPGVAHHVAHCARCQATSRRVSRVAPLRQIAGVFGLAGAGARGWLSDASLAIREHASIFHAAARLRLGQPLADAALVTAAATSFVVASVPLAAVSTIDARIPPMVAVSAKSAQVSTLAPLVDDRPELMTLRRDRPGAGVDEAAHGSADPDRLSEREAVGRPGDHHPTPEGETAGGDHSNDSRTPGMRPNKPEHSAGTGSDNEPPHVTPATRPSEPPHDGITSEEPEGGMMPSPDHGGAQERHTSDVGGMD